MGQAADRAVAAARSAVIIFRAGIGPEAGIGAGQVVSEVFRGEITAKVDAKARVLIPVSFRRVLEAGDPGWSSGTRPKLVMVYGDPRRNFVECFTVAEMRRLEGRIMRLPPGDTNRRILQRNYITLSLVTEVDEDGRIVLPTRVREKLALGPDEIGPATEVTFAGVLDTFHLWKSATYDAEIRPKDARDLADLPEDQDLLSLLGTAPPEG